VRAGLLSAVLAGRRSARTVARDIGKVFTEQNRTEQAAQRVRTAQNRAQKRQGAFTQLEADLAEELTAIDDEWNARAAAVETIEVPLEQSDIQVVAGRWCGSRWSDTRGRPAATSGVPKPGDDP
jgi:hypothetical protein